MEQAWSVIKVLLKRFWLFLLIITAVYVCVGYFEKTYPTICFAVEKIADIIVIGVIWDMVVEGGQLMGVFKEELQAIVMHKKFVGGEKRLYPIWESLSKELFKQKFPEIRKDLLKTIHNYLPKDAVSYYKNHNAEINLEWVDAEHQIIRETKEVAFELVASTRDEIEHHLKTWTRVGEGRNFTNTITRITVEGGTPDGLGEVTATRRDEGYIIHEQPLKLRGKDKYRIRYTREKTYEFEKDYYVGFMAQYIVHHLEVKLTLPNDLDALFICRGTQNEYEDCGTTRGQIKKEYNGIVLPRQGYIFALKRRPLE